MENQQATAHVKPLSLVDMSSAFVVLGLGISLSILVFLIELIYKRIKDHYFTDDLLNKKNNKAHPTAVRDTKKGSRFNLRLQGRAIRPKAYVSHPITIPAAK